MIQYSDVTFKKICIFLFLAIMFGVISQYRKIKVIVFPGKRLFIVFFINLIFCDDKCLTCIVIVTLLGLTP